MLLLEKIGENRKGNLLVSNFWKGNTKVYGEIYSKFNLNNFDAQVLQ